MFKKAKRIEHKIKGFIIEKNLHRTWKQRIGHTLCLIIPIISAFAGWYLAPSLYSKISEKQVTEGIKFIITLIFFAIPTLIIFVFSRDTNPIMKISVKSPEEAPQEES